MLKAAALWDLMGARLRVGNSTMYFFRFLSVMVPHPF